MGARISVTRGAGLRLQLEIVERCVLTVVDRGVIRQTHDLESLVDDGSEAAERDLSALLHHLLDDLDEDADADRIDDLRFFEIQKESLHAVIHQLVGAVGDLLPSYVVDVALREKDGTLGAPVDGDSQFLGHDFFSSAYFILGASATKDQRLIHAFFSSAGFSNFTMWIVVPSSPLMISTSSMCACM